MIPIRVLLVDDPGSGLRLLREGLERMGGFEVLTAASPPWGMLCLARHQPDVLIVHPHAGRGTIEEWRRAIRHFRASRPLSLLVLAGRLSQREREFLEEMADLGVIPHPADPAQIEEILADWAGTEENLSRAA